MSLADAIVALINGVHYGNATEAEEDALIFACAALEARVAELEGQCAGSSAGSSVTAGETDTATSTSAGDAGTTASPDLAAILEEEVNRLVVLFVYEDGSASVDIGEGNPPGHLLIANANNMDRARYLGTARRAVALICRSVAERAVAAERERWERERCAGRSKDATVPEAPAGSQEVEDVNTGARDHGPTRSASGARPSATAESAEPASETSPPNPDPLAALVERCVTVRPWDDGHWLEIHGPNGGASVMVRCGRDILLRAAILSIIREAVEMSLAAERGKVGRLTEAILLLGCLSGTQRYTTVGTEMLVYLHPETMDKWNAVVLSLAARDAEPGKETM